VGIALSPEYVYALGPGMIAPDDRRFAILWTGRRVLESALGAGGEFNDLAIRVKEAAALDDVARQVEAVLAPYGAADVHGRERQPSHAFLSAMFHQIAGVGRIAQERSWRAIASATTTGTTRRLWKRPKRTASASSSGRCETSSSTSSPLLRSRGLLSRRLLFSLR